MIFKYSWFGMSLITLLDIFKEKLIIPQFESRNPGALFVALSRAKSAGNDFVDPDFAWHSSVLVNEDRLCHVVKSATVEASYILIWLTFTNSHTLTLMYCCGPTKF
jgi:hypothetical protein